MFNSIRLNGLYYGALDLSPGSYINFGVQGVNGYGLRDNAGSIEFKDVGGNWNTLANLATNDWARSGGFISPLVDADKVSSNSYYLDNANHDIRLTRTAASNLLLDNGTAGGQCNLSVGAFFDDGLNPQLTVGNAAAGSLPGFFIGNAVGAGLEFFWDTDNQAGFCGTSSYATPMNFDALKVLFQVSSHGNVGIDIDPPTTKLDVNGVTRATGFQVGAAVGIDTTITTAGLVGKTITVTKGIITSFA